MEANTERTATDRPGDLKILWETMKNDTPRKRTRDIATSLGVSEGELVASACDGENIIRLKKDWEKLFGQLEQLGPLMALTRNRSAVHEKNGVYRNVSFEGHAGLVLDEQIDLRLFHKRWGSAFALPVKNPRGTLHSIQIFDKKGEAVHKIYLKDASRLEDYLRLVDRFRYDDQSSGIELNSGISRKKNRRPDEVNRDQFLGEWSELKDTHAFFPLLLKHKVSRTVALELTEGQFAWAVSNSVTRRMLKRVVDREVPIMVFVGNPGVVQIHSGPVRRVVEKGDWINILDPGFNLHMRQDHVASSWIVEKPTEDGTVTSIEVFDKEGELIVTFFGARKPGRPELESWRVVTDELKTLVADHGR